MRLDHLLSKGTSKGYSIVELSKGCFWQPVKAAGSFGISSGDALKGNTRTHPEHGG